MNFPNRFREYIEFRKKYQKFLGALGDYKKGEIEIVTNAKLFAKCEASAAKQMMGEGISASEAKVRAKIGVREKNRWGVSLCEPVRLPTGAVHPNTGNARFWYQARYSTNPEVLTEGPKYKKLHIRQVLQKVANSDFSAIDSAVLFQTLYGQKVLVPTLDL